MVVPELEMVSQGEVESELQPDQQAKNNYPFSNLGRQSSIYSLTLDEFQHTLCEGGKNFGSMNMDEFLTSIWNAEENQGVSSSHNHSHNTNTNHNSNNGHVSLIESSEDTKQHSLSRQGSLAIPPPLCRKTVDEVWSEIHKGRQHQSRPSADSNGNDNPQSSEPAQRQPTFGEMTLEDFLVKAGVVRGQGQVPMEATQLQQHYALYPTSPSVGPSFRTATGVPGGAVSVASINGGRGIASTVAAPLQPVSQAGGAIGDSAGFTENGKRDGGYRPPPPLMPLGTCYGGRMMNGGGGYLVAPPTIGMPAPVSPVSPDGMCSNPVDSTGSQYGMDMSALRGRKRIIDGPVERVVERRQRRMIKNRESAARSRARKQAYTVELEAELNQLREENAQLKQALAELERKRKEQGEEVKMKVPSKPQKTREKHRNLRRNLSFPL